MKRRTFCQGAIVALIALPLPAVAEPIHATLYKNPQCSCCEGYAAYLRQNGFEVDVKPTKKSAARPACLKNCRAATRCSWTDTWSTGMCR